MRLAQCAGRQKNEASEPYLSDIGVPLKGFLLKNAYHFLQQKGLGGLYPSCEDCLSFAVVQPFSQESRTATVPKVFQISLCGVEEADLELFCTSWRSGFLGERL